MPNPENRNELVTIAISMGDANGIGPEVLLKALAGNIDFSRSIPVILGQRHILEYYRDRLALDLKFHAAETPAHLSPGHIYLLETGRQKTEIAPGRISADAGKLSMEAVAKGIELCTAQQADALVTAPIHKEAIQHAGYRVPGHTEFLTEKTGAVTSLMMMLGSKLNIGLVTAHIPLADVSGELSYGAITSSLNILHETMKTEFGITDPALAALGLNPHAGDGGVLGREEEQTLIPALEAARTRGIRVDGPFPADGFFGRGSHRQYDAVLAMYHDQGLIPFKLLSTNEGVNFTAGLPIIRTSPDHGTAYNLSGKGEADCSSFTEAYNRAVTMAQNRRKNTE